MPDRLEIRISDAEREQPGVRLIDAFPEGRLTVTEFDARVASVLPARTASELTPRLADLPGTEPRRLDHDHPAVRSIRGPGSDRGGRGDQWRHAVAEPGLSRVRSSL